MDDYVSKPIDGPSLFAAVNRQGAANSNRPPQSTDPSKPN
jgi:hypothetical protein